MTDDSESTLLSVSKGRFSVWVAYSQNRGVPYRRAPTDSGYRFSDELRYQLLLELPVVVGFVLPALGFDEFHYVFECFVDEECSVVTSLLVEFVFQ